MEPAHGVVFLPRETPLEKTELSVGDSVWVRASTSPSVLEAHLAQTCAGPVNAASCSLYEVVCVLVLLNLGLVSVVFSIPLALTLFPPPLRQGSLSPEGRDLEMSHVGHSLSLSEHRLAVGTKS